MAESRRFRRIRSGSILRAGKIYMDTGPAGVRPGAGGRFFVGCYRVGRLEGPSYPRIANEKSAPAPRPEPGRSGVGVYLSGP